ncbi:acyl carrier protein [candidate division KSB1 bacterium]|jgi:acyl carrier protein|nr:MAG: acyl carrier protein [candidate division KSB1 bacterium]
MQKDEIRNRVKKVIAQVLGMDQNEISDDANFIFDLGADSRQSLELVAAFEEEFDIEMDEDKALEVQTVADAVDFIAQYVK